MAVFLWAIFLGAIFQGHFTGVYFSSPRKNQQNLSPKIETRPEIVGARNYFLEFMLLRGMILHKTDFAILTVFRGSLAELCALLINAFENFS